MVRADWSEPVSGVISVTHGKIKGTLVSLGEFQVNTAQKNQSFQRLRDNVLNHRTGDLISITG